MSEKKDLSLGGFNNKISNFLKHLRIAKVTLTHFSSTLLLEKMFVWARYIFPAKKLTHFITRRRQPDDVCITKIVSEEQKKILSLLSSLFLLEGCPI